MTTLPPTTASQQLFFSPESGAWKALKPDVSGETDNAKKQQMLSEAAAVRDELKAVLLSSLQMQHVVALAGSGTSLGSINGPSMWTLWDHCVNSNPGDGNDKRNPTDQAQAVIDEIGYEVAVERENIEALLSRCDAYLQIKKSASVEKFVSASKAVILKKCSAFLDGADDSKLASHRTFLHRLSRRRVRDSRMKLFTTNYDLCFERAAGKQGLVLLDGFSFTQPRQFDPRFFLYDIVRRPSTGDEVGNPLEGVFHLYKLHGSVNWDQSPSGDIEIKSDPTPETACLIYPATGKYQQSYMQPHLELISQYFAALREPNTCLIVAGFGFNDDHLSEPIIAAARTNPHLRLIIVNPSAHDLTAQAQQPSRFWGALNELAKQGEDVWLINATFSEFAEMIPDLKSLTPAQRLTRDIKSLVKPT
ncbi:MULTISPECIES: SIR2 family protein [Xanthomonas]|uniref:SIR2 family protein n=1 Tax=Xanthomonas hortorum TaxID=56454 RepID=A0AA47ETL2_9XANT|nr:MULTISPECIES: SIR2 family protein [Xanthomonas]MEA9732076.1 SIR2 family protein [Xanthomonas campestris]WAH63915.1 SIR2 family protein [Xanthomonas hortorum]